MAGKNWEAWKQWRSENPGPASSAKLAELIDYLERIEELDYIDSFLLVRTMSPEKERSLHHCDDIVTLPPFGSREEAHKALSHLVEAFLGPDSKCKNTHAPVLDPEAPDLGSIIVAAISFCGDESP